MAEKQARGETGCQGADEPTGWVAFERTANARRDIKPLFEYKRLFFQTRAGSFAEPNQSFDFLFFGNFSIHSRSFLNSARVTGNAEGGDFLAI